MDETFSVCEEMVNDDEDNNTTHDQCFISSYRTMNFNGIVSIDFNLKRFTLS